MTTWGLASHGSRSNLGIELHTTRAAPPLVLVFWVGGRGRGIYTANRRSMEDSVCTWLSTSTRKWTYSRLACLDWYDSSTSPFTLSHPQTQLNSKPVNEPPAPPTLQALTLSPVSFPTPDLHINTLYSKPSTNNLQRLFQTSVPTQSPRLSSLQSELIWLWVWQGSWYLSLSHKPHITSNSILKKKNSKNIMSCGFFSINNIQVNWSGYG